jgi:hypothetical protein
MKLDIKGMAVTLGLVWGAAVLLVGIANLIWPNYGQAFLQVVASVYPGYTAGASVGQVILGTLYGLVVREFAIQQEAAMPFYLSVKDDVLNRLPELRVLFAEAPACVWR